MTVWNFGNWKYDGADSVGLCGAAGACFGKLSVVWWPALW